MCPRFLPNTDSLHLCVVGGSFPSSVLAHAVQVRKSEKASRDSGDYAGNMSQGREARSPLGREAEETFERFCNQVPQMVEPLFRDVSEE